jgi:hypothetical protein
MGRTGLRHVVDVYLMNQPPGHYRIAMQYRLGYIGWFANNAVVSLFDRGLKPLCITHRKFAVWGRGIVGNSRAPAPEWNLM